MSNYLYRYNVAKQKWGFIRIDDATILLETWRFGIGEIATFCAMVYSKTEVAKLIGREPREEMIDAELSLPIFRLFQNNRLLCDITAHQSEIRIKWLLFNRDEHYSSIKELPCNMPTLRCHMIDNSFFPLNCIEVNYSGDNCSLRSHCMINKF